MKKKAIAVVSVCEAEHSPLLFGHLPSDNSLAGFLHKEKMTHRRQDVEQFYRLNGAIYTVNCKNFEKDQYIYTEGCYAYIMPIVRSVDIDTEYDFLHAEAIFKCIK